MSRADPWMPFYPGDYLRDTTRLTTEQHGAYMLLILDYWSNGAPPDDDRTLALICRMDPKRWRQIRPVIEPFFTVEQSKWTHRRIESELERSRAFREKQQANGKLGGRPPKTQNQSQSESQNKPNGLPKPKPKESLSQSQEPNGSIPLDKSNGAIDPEKVMFDSGVALLAGASVAEPRARSMLGKWKRDYGAEAVLVGIGVAHRECSPDPVALIEKTLRHRAQSPPAEMTMPC